MTQPEIAQLGEEIRCPVDGARMWIKTPGYYGCKHGHVMAANAILPPAEPKNRLVVVQPVEHWPWWRHAEIPWTLVALLLVAQIVEVLT